MRGRYLVDTVAGRVDATQLLVVISGVAQPAEGLEHMLKCGMDPLDAELLYLCTAWQCKTRKKEVQFRETCTCNPKKQTNKKMIL